eukprot:364791-Chlamydomonas_euryale.AAC.6
MGTRRALDSNTRKMIMCMRQPPDPHTRTMIMGTRHPSGPDHINLPHQDDDHGHEAPVRPGPHQPSAPG